MEYQNNKLRHELKYYINEAAYYDLRGLLKTLFLPDENMKNENGYGIRSMYFDDYENSCAKDKEDGVRLRHKYRVRIYDGSDQVIKLERKSKFDSYISKISASLTLDEYRRILNHDYSFLPFMRKEVCTDLFCAYKTKLMRPTVVVDYQREAYYLREGNVRITFDKHLRGGMNCMDMFDPNLILTSVLPRNILIIEVKYDDYLPDFVRRILKGHTKNYSAISKFLICTDELRKVKKYV